MIDIHNHLLNNVDDGSRDPIESLTSIKLAEEARIYRYNINTTLYRRLLRK